MAEQKRVSQSEHLPGNPAEDFDEVLQQAHRAIYMSIELADGERIVFVESYCKKCRSKAIRAYHEKNKIWVCLGCGTRISP